MGRSVAHPNHQCVSSNDVQGTEVYGTEARTSVKLITLSLTSCLAGSLTRL
jgi:hypothetical protein